MYTRADEEQHRTIPLITFGDVYVFANVFTSNSSVTFSIEICGGVRLVMKATKLFPSRCFTTFGSKDHIPEDHLLRLVDRHVDFAFVRETMKESYRHTGRRPSIDPEVLLHRLTGYLYETTIERRLVEDVWMHLAYRWFTGSHSAASFRWLPFQALHARLSCYRSSQTGRDCATLSPVDPGCRTRILPTEHGLARFSRREFAAHGSNFRSTRNPGAIRKLAHSSLRERGITVPN
ncbi:MAG: transposase [Acidobacteriaceae bacterium]|nr:transposase [Acidobacteriaceae bacterium]